MATGGGPPPEEPSDMDTKIYNLVPQQFEKIRNEFDSDVYSPKSRNSDNVANGKNI